MNCPHNGCKFDNFEEVSWSLESSCTMLETFLVLGSSFLIPLLIYVSRIVLSETQVTGKYRHISNYHIVCCDCVAILQCLLLSPYWAGNHLLYGLLEEPQRENSRLLQVPLIVRYHAFGLHSSGLILSQSTK